MPMGFDIISKGKMLSLMFSFFSNLIYYFAISAFFLGIVLYILSKITNLLPIFKGYSLLMQVCGIFLTLGGLAYVSNINGYERRVAEDKAEIERLNTEARAKEAELGQKLARATSQLKQAKNDIKTKQASLTASADAGSLRLCPSGSVQADSSSSSASGNTTHESDSERQTVKALIGIAADGDTAITSLNACIAQYQQVMKTVNEGVK